MINIKDIFLSTRNHFTTLCKGLETEDYSIQPTEFVSPPKWHLAHTTWFFEQFVLKEFGNNYIVYNNDFSYLFNSYYNNAGERVLRSNRGLMTRPTVEEVYAYRNYVDAKMTDFLDDNPSGKALEIIELGINHEQQHQELFYYDIKYIFGNQPTFPTLENNVKLQDITQKEEFITIEEGIYQIGHNTSDFSFDNELSAHKAYIHTFIISKNLTTNAEYIAFIESGGYTNFNLWHAEGWDYITKNEISAPLYWHKVKGDWYYYTLDGFKPVELNKPVMHISLFEAYAYAEWKQMRLPTEFEWEVAADYLNYGQLWEWTNSAYLPYPNFSKAPGALGEYNGKFMINQHVLRGASIATPKSHSRKTYRNFFQPNMRWLFSGIRLAQ